jgi:hypothetical protein
MEPEDRIGGVGEGRLLGRLAAPGRMQVVAPDNPNPPPTQTVEVPYQSPNQRAKASAYRASWAQLLALSVALVVIPALITFLNSGDWSQAALVALGQGIGQAVLGVIFQFLLKLRDANAEDAPPASRTGE